MRIGPSILCALALAAPLAARAEIYRWVDDRGVINYSSTRPEGVKKFTQIAEDSGRVSTVPGISPELIAQQRQLELEARIQRLERELYEQRAREAMAAAAQAYPAYPYPAYYPGYAYSAYYPGYAYAYPAHRHRFAAVRPVFPRHAHAVVRPAPARGMRR